MVRRIAATLAAVLLGVLLLPGVAWAGGPTSVLLTSPDNDRATALYYADPAYEQLTGLLGDQPAADPAAPDPAGISATYVTVTWLIHDVSVWRVDRVFLTSDGDMWVATWTGWNSDGSLSTNITPGGSADAIVHRPTDAATLRALFDDLGLLTGAPIPAADVVAPQAVAPPAPAPADQRDGEWWWAAAGALVGAAAAALALRNSSPLRRRLLPVEG